MQCRVTHSRQADALMQCPVCCHRYWSSAGCLYHHLYPVGFKATRHVFNREWTMMIEKGQQGPIFTVGGAGARQWQRQQGMQQWQHWQGMRCVCCACWVLGQVRGGLRALGDPFAAHGLCAAAAQVTDGNSGRVFTGTSPTQPWTAVGGAHAGSSDAHHARMVLAMIDCSASPCMTHAWLRHAPAHNAKRSDSDSR